MTKCARTATLLGAAALLGAAGMSWADKEPVVQVTVEKPFGGLPALSKDGSRVALPVIETDQYGKAILVRFVAVGSAKGEDFALVRPKPGGDPLTAAQERAALRKSVPKLNKRLSAKGFRSLPWSEPPEGATIPLKLQVDGIAFAFTLNGEKLSVAAESGDKNLGAAVLTASNPTVRGVAIVRGDKLTAYVVVDSHYRPTKEDEEGGANATDQTIIHAMALPR